MNEEIKPTKSPEVLDVGFGITLNANTNFQPRCPFVLILDTSSSMTGAPIDELNKALPVLFTELAANELTALRVEPCLITCGGQVKLVQSFMPLMNMPALPGELKPDGDTPLGAAVRLAIRTLDERRQFYRDSGLASYRPVVAVLTDGRPTDYEWTEASSELRQRATDEKRGWTVIPVGIGPNADMQALSAIAAPALPPVRLHGLKFAELFRWLSESLQVGASRSPSLPQALTLPPSSTWATPSTQP